ncbi:MAG TPA: xanthine dehydrogenase family protein molybdopterin-binding subunit [Stellaceae bacterium]|nr:xanthine dehydrogenase family protein molybdopterin-binding subunit [Stellaceae bacterium]
MGARNVLVGSPVERLEDLRLLRGRGTFVDDLARENVLHAAVLRSPVAHGRLRAIDTKAALALPGVHAVITAADLGARVPNIPLRLIPLPEMLPFEQPVIAASKVRYVGEPVAVVLADSAALAEDALEVVRLDIEPLPAVTDRVAAAADKVLLFEEHGTNRAVTFTVRQGDAAAAFKEAPYVRRERFSVHRHTAVTLEPRGVLTEWDRAQGHLTIWGAAKVPFFNRQILARLMVLPESAISMIENDVGGGFGNRGEFYPEDFLIPFAARHVGRPVKWTEDRREHLIAANHARETDIEIEIACRKDGTILALRGHAYADMGAYVRTNGAVGPRNSAQFLAGPYHVPHLDIDVKLLVTNKTPVGTYRGPGRFEADFFRERLVDMAARDLGIDPVELRRRNFVAESEMPYAVAAVTPSGAETEFDSGDYRITLDRCLQEIGWSDKQRLQGKFVDGRYHGIAIGCFIEGGAAGPKETARLVLEPDGRIAVLVGSAGVGQGLETAFAQIAADALELPLERIAGVRHGSTTLLPEGYGSYHSRAVVMGGSAVLAAASAFKTALRDAAASRLGCDAAAVELVDGEARAGGRSVTLAALAEDGIAADGSFTNHHHTYAYGTHAAHVAVDPRTGHVALVDYAAVEDVGRIINPMMMRGQQIGAIVQGLGGTLLEHLVYDAEGQLLSGTLADYLLPTAGDFPSIRAVTLEEKPSPINPLGAKGAGEGGIVPVGGVIANAVAAALSSLGVEPRALPLSPPRLWRLIKEAQGRTARTA